MLTRRFKTSETLLGIETRKEREGRSPMFGFKTSETLLGIETLRHIPVTRDEKSFKTSETLLGIETWHWQLGLKPHLASKPLKPF